MCICTTQLEIIVCCLRLALTWLRGFVVNWSSVILKLITPQEVIVVHQPLDEISILIAWHIYIYMDIILYLYDIIDYDLL